MVGTFIKIIDPSQDSITLDDRTIRRLVIQSGDTKEVLMVKFSEKALIKSLQTIQAYYELIIFTVIPRRFLDLILEQIP